MLRTFKRRNLMAGENQSGFVPKPKDRPPLKTATTTVEKKQDTYSSGKKGPIERTVVVKKETTPVKPA